MRATIAEPKQREEKMKKLFEESLTRRAHPTLEHLLPIYIAAGAAGSDAAERIWTFPEASLSWAQYRFGSATIE
jgi:aromatic ring-opening dioxygenase catalytic subunit (LigB family)